ncbi:methyltransferase domain-containing protein [Streptomyces sp. SID486]|uniref:class I SAM-dependent methyltransferase n=1 Tax=Streptomyces sp. SID486 TaxID=2690264 RepID=UPI0013BB110D|nr:class I SAM-dependent methyltransferase [Streptomyces sp. SID486]MYW17082.1 methyltransferase domain-containing protein [Streptomyces sp. SID2955]MYX99238.1 methyltransferase domain-containing protein [Streptomyces sp. SID486]
MADGILARDTARPGAPDGDEAPGPGDDTPDYWDVRHRDQDELASGGHIGLDRAGNELFYALRLGNLLGAVGDLSSATAPLFVLDAGCGKGYFARALARCGHRVDAFDASEEALDRARAAGGGPRYTRARLEEWRSPWPYDIVLCVDVLFHLLDDTEWAAALRNLASLVRLTGRLIVTDEDTAVPRARGDYILHRPTAAYRSVLEPLGLRHTEFRPYGFREIEVGFHVFTRIR